MKLFFTLTLAKECQVTNIIYKLNDIEIKIY